jgi:hypothetical protein
MFLDHPDPRKGGMEQSIEFWKDVASLLNTLDAWEIFIKRFNGIEFKKTNKVKIYEKEKEEIEYCSMFVINQLVFYSTVASVYICNLSQSRTVCAEFEWLISCCHLTIS